MLFIHCGCKVNQYETNAMIQQFIKCKYKILDVNEKADIYVINTCTVTNMSDRKSRQLLRRAKEHNPKALIVVCGCYAQVAKSELEKIEEIDLILGINEKNNIVEYIENYQKEKMENEHIADVMKQTEFIDFGEVTYTDKSRAVIKVQDGCDRFCSYCIIPYARGRIRSRKIESVLNEVKSISEKGIKEVVITGIHVTSYGRDLKENVGLIDLLEEINKIDKIKRIRLSSLEPTIVTEEFVKRLVKLDKICDHFHLSLQSGCDGTLKRMNRRYTTSEFRKCVKLLREAYPNVSLTTDIIVGFPGETDAEFEETYKFLKEMDFYKMHIFKYSKRDGTKAADMPNQVDGNIKDKRSKKLIALSDENEKDKNKQYIGKELEVLFEKEENGFAIGHTKNYMLVNAKNKENKNVINKIEKAIITDTKGVELIGILL